MQQSDRFGPFKSQTSLWLRFPLKSPCEWREKGGSKFNWKRKTTCPVIWCQRISLSVCDKFWPRLSPDWQNTKTVFFYTGPPPSPAKPCLAALGLVLILGRISGSEDDASLVRERERLMLVRIHRSKFQDGLDWASDIFVRQANIWKLIRLLRTLCLGVVWQILGITLLSLGLVGISPPWL